MAATSAASARCEAPRYQRCDRRLLVIERLSPQWSASSEGNLMTKVLVRFQDASTTLIGGSTAGVDAAHLARELHDTVGHALSGILLSAAGARHAAGRAARTAASDQGVDTLIATLVDTLGAVEACATEAINELHTLLGSLRAPDEPVLPVDSQATRRLADVRQLVDRVGATGMPVTLSEQGSRGEVTPVAEHVAYRVVQECLTNAMKHAGIGGLADVQLIWAADRLEVVVDTMAGVANLVRLCGSGSGLAGLAARVNTIGGRFTAGPTRAGFLSRAVLPCSPRGTRHTSPAMSDWQASA